MTQSKVPISMGNFCSNCGLAVAPTGSFCSSCGMKRGSPLLACEKSTENANEETKSALGQVVLIVTIFGTVVALGIWAMSATVGSRSFYQTQTPSPDDRLGANGVEAVKAQLRDPTSAVFSNVSGDTLAGCSYGTVNAKNGFGGFAGTDEYVISGTNITFKSEGLISFVEAREDCGARRATEQLKTETDPKMRTLLQNIISIHNHSKRFP